MRPRPTSVTVIAWIQIVTMSLSLFTLVPAMNNPQARELMAKSSVPITVQIAIAYVGLILTITAAIAMLKGYNWGRLLYVVWHGCSILFSFATSPLKGAIIPGMLVYLLFSFLLYRPVATAYFRPEEATADAPGL